MATKISIVNDALSRLGDNTISDLNEKTSRSQLALSVFDSVRDSAIRSLWWNSCVRREILSPLSTKPSFGYSYQFIVPRDCLRIISISAEDDVVDFTVENGRILTNTATLELKYVFKNEDISTWDAGLINVVTLRLAEALAYPITKSSAQTQAMGAMAERALMEARSADVTENTMPYAFDDSLIGRRGI